jgi:dihydroorotase
MAEDSGVVVAVKLYPAGATTNSQAGVTDLFKKCMPVLEEMAEQRLPLLVKTVISLRSWDGLRILISLPYVYLVPSN